MAVDPQYATFIGRGVLLSDNGGQSFEDFTEGLAATALTGVAFDDTDGLYVSAMDGGLYRREPAGGWTALGGPPDARVQSGSAEAPASGYLPANRQ